jgi:hypothetical protein
MAMDLQPGSGKKRQRERLIAVLSACAGFLLTLPMPVFISQEDSGARTFGFVVLLMGWTGIFASGLQLAWFANPFLLTALILVVRDRIFKAVWFSALGAILALNTLLVPVQQFLKNEAGDRTGYRLGPGAYLWIAVHWGFFAWLLVERYRVGLRLRAITGQAGHAAPAPRGSKKPAA